MQNRGYYAVQCHRGRYQSKARMRLPISDNTRSIADILSRTVSELSQRIVQILDTALLRPPCGLETTYDVLHWKARSGLPISVN